MSHCENIDGQCGASWCDCDYQRRKSISQNTEPMETMTDTPETDQAERESIAAYIEAYGPDAVFPCDGYDHARKLERERDELREDLEFRRGLYALQTEALEKAREERDEARQWESQALVARIQRDQFSKTLGEVREILCDALPNENTPTLIMVQKLVDDHTDIIFAVRALKLAKGRFHTEQAAINLFTLIP